MKKGIRCAVCTGCGRCPGVNRKIHIVTNQLKKVPVDLRNDGHIRLITADVGTTTIAMQIHGEDGSVTDSFVAVNPQVKYGADVLSRIAAAEQKAAAEDMRQMVLAQLEKGVLQFKRQLEPEEKAIMVLAANTTMVYLLMGLNPAELGHAPFAAEHLDAVETEVAGVTCYIFPGLSAFVGGDIVAGIRACGIQKKEALTLLIDLGTNGEMVLGNKEKLYACATAAGPAFEGGVNRGVWGADMVSLIAEMLRKNLLDRDGLIAENYFNTGVRIGDVCVTQEAVRAIQLAKAAIAAGIDVLCDRYGCVLADIDEVVLAGGFGYYLNPADAAEISMLPRELTGRTVAGGNTALTGALYAGESLLKGKTFQQAVYENTDGTERHIINLAEEASFENKYLESIRF